jgi:transketolase
VSNQPPLDWTVTDERAVDLIRVLAMDSVQKVGNGHPGTAMSLAPAAYLLFQHLLRHDPADPQWPGRDRFDVQALYQALLTAREHTDAPSLIALSTIIGWPAPHKQNTGAAHGSALGADEVAATKQVLGFDPGADFPVEDEALGRARQVAERGKSLHAEWEQSFAAWSDANADRRALFDRLAARQLPDGWTEVLRRGHLGPGGVHAVRGMVQRAGGVLPARGTATDHPRAGVGRGRHYRTLAVVRRGRGRFNRSRPFRGFGRVPEDLSGVWHHGGAGIRRRTRQSGPV